MPRFLLYFTLIALVFACNPDDETVVPNDGDLTPISYSPNAYELLIPEGLPNMFIPEDNPLTLEGVQLGRNLFYDPILSADSTMSCSSCHLPVGSFTDNLAVSKGIDDIAGRRSSMSLLNVGFYNTGLFWDGRAATLEDQALMPVEDPIELHNDWANLEVKFRNHDTYPSMFRKAFGISHKNEITKELAGKALAQFERILISSGNSRFDKFMRGELFFSDDELNGFDMFFDNSSFLPDAECGHCHNAPLMTTNEYFNNGLDSVDNLNDFEDLGLGERTQDPFDNGKFRTPTLRNISFSAPYMHDGRFDTLEEVIAHYNSGGQPAPNVDPLILPLNLTEEQIQQLLAFIKTLDDPEFLENPDFQNPF